MHTLESRQKSRAIEQVMEAQASAERMARAVLAGDELGFRRGWRRTLEACQRACAILEDTDRAA